MAGTLSFKQGSGRDLAADYKRLNDSGLCEIPKVIDYLLKNNFNKLSFLKTKPIIINSIGRDYDPANPYSGKTYAQVAAKLSSELNTNITELQVADKFLHRSSKRVSENEYLYRQGIFKSQDGILGAIKSGEFVPYSAHMWLPNYNGIVAAMDISTKQYTDAEITALVDAIKENFINNKIDPSSNLYIMYHKIDGNFNHIHIEDKRLYNTNRDALVDVVNKYCDYKSTFKKENSKVGSIPKTVKTKAISQNSSEDKAITISEIAEQTNQQAENEVITEAKDTRSILPNHIDDSTGLMEVLVIGDQNFDICPISQISYSQSMQFVRFSALRTVGDPKIANNIMPNNVTVNIIFPNADAINNSLSALVAQFMVTPVTKVQSRFISRTLKSVNINSDGGLDDNFIDNKSKSAEDETMWMIMTDFNVRTIPNFPEAFEANITLEAFEERVFGGGLDFLESYNDVVEKYRRKGTLTNSGYSLPSEKNMLLAEKSYSPGNINIVKDPNKSTLYKDFYQSVKLTFKDYNVADYSGKFSVLYNTQKFNRETIRNTNIKLQEAYNASLEETIKIYALGGPAFEKYLNGKGLGGITISDVRSLATSSVEATTKMLTMVARSSSAIQTFQGLRYYAVDATVRLSEIDRNLESIIDQVCTSELVKVDKQVLYGIVKTALGYAGKLEAVGSGLTSTGKKNDKNEPILNNLIKTGSVDISSGGTLGALEVLVGANLFHLSDNDIKEKDKKIAETVAANVTANEQIPLLTKAIEKLSRLLLYNGEDTATDVTDGSGVSQIPVTYSLSTLCDGKNSITTGIALSISNKVIPQQIIGWRQPMYQHLGRSDWSINMTIVCTGDDAVREVMYIMNRIGLFSKQIQFTTPARFMNLDTTLHIVESDPIFGALGINKVVLNTAEISSVQGQPNTYQISLGMEQADLILRDMEKLTKEGSLKEVNNSVSKKLLLDIIPVMKALVIREDRNDYGMFLNFEKIKEVVENKNLDGLWKSAGMNSNTFDYMDKYNYYKLRRKADKMLSPISEFDVAVSIIFPKDLDGSDFVPYAISFIEPETKKKIELSEESILALNNLEQMVVDESNGSLLWEHGSLVYKDVLVLSLKEYYIGLITLLNESFVSINNKIESDNMSFRTSTTGTISIVAGLVVLDAIAGVLLFTTPPFISIPILLATVGLHIAVGFIKANDIVTTIRNTLEKIVPSLVGQAINTKLIDLAKEFIVDDASLSIFSYDFQLSSKQDDNNPITLQSRIRALRQLISASLGSCYDDFKNQIIIASDITKLPIPVIDPAFYLYAQDVITSSLIRESEADITSQISLLASRVSSEALMLGATIEDYFGVDKTDLTKISKPVPNDSKFINKQDIQWIIEAKNQIAKMQLAAFSSPSRDNLQKLKNLQQNGKLLLSVFYGPNSKDANDDKGGGGTNDYWTNEVIGERVGAGLEQVFLKIQLLNFALRHDLIKTNFEHAANKVREGSKKIENQDKTNYDNTQYAQYLTYYNRLMVDKEYYNAKAIDESGLTEVQNTSDKDTALTWYDAIIENGSISDALSPAGSVDYQFKNKYGCSIWVYFAPFKELQQLLHDIDIMARCKKATTNGVAASMLVKQMALAGDPRMLEKRADEIQTLMDIMYKASIVDATSNPARIFPTYKIYFIEEDAPEWGIYNDFYDYSAVQEITVVKDRKSASDTCVIKLSNVMGKLTDSFAENVPEYGTMNLAMSSMMLKPGTSILVKMGYSNSQIELPVVFHGIVIEVNPGPIVEIICQSYGAELNEVIAQGGGVHFGIFGTVKALGDVATWALQASIGLNHLGKMGYADFGVEDKLRLSGTSTSGLQGKIKLGSFVSGLPGLSINDPRDDNIFLPYNIGDSQTKEITGSLDLALTLLLNKFRVKSNITFDWYIRDQSIWDTIQELVMFSPDFIQTVLPYNDNVFPFIPTIRNTLYVGPRKGYYKYTDFYSIISKDTSSINVTSANKLEDLLFKATQNFFNNTNAYIINLIVNRQADYYQHLDKPIIDDLIAFFKTEQDLYTLVLEYANLSGVGLLNLNFNSLKDDEKRKTMYDLVVFYRDKFTDYIDTYERNTIHKNTNRNFISALKNAITTDVGFIGQYHNIHGENHQYKKVQTHHMATSYTNIVNNNIIASADGWANRINLICPPDPTSYKKIEDVPIKDRDNFISSFVNLDDNIFDDQIRPKTVFVNNIDPSMFDDSFWSQKVIEGKAADTTVNTRLNSYVSTVDGVPTVKELYNLKDKEPGSVAKDDGIIPDLQNEGSTTYTRNGYELLPSRWRVAISHLAEEARDMYNGELTITGNSCIKPYDIIHMMDYTNDMHGSFEVGRVIHSLSPQTGFTTRIKPDLIVNQKNKFNQQEITVVTKMMSLATTRAWCNFIAVAIPSLVTGFTVSSLLKTLVRMGANKLAVKAATEALGNTAKAATSIEGAATVAKDVQTVAKVSRFTSAGIQAGIGTAMSVGLLAITAYIGYKSFVYKQERVIMIMNNIVGRDAIELMPLMYRGVPYVAGIEGYKKDSYLRHMYTQVLDSDSNLNIFERIGIMSKPLEYDFYKNVADDSSVFSFLQSTWGEDASVYKGVENAL